MIVADHITKTFKLYRKPSDRLKEIVFRKSFHKDFHAVSEVSFTVKAGETLGIIGENGAGKSTLLKLLTGVLIPDTGQVHLAGKITGLLELGTGFNREFSGIDNIVHNATYLGLSRREIDSRLDKIVEFTELGDFIHEPIKTYSSGMVMRLAFSVAIHADPQVFVVDEALSVGDAYFQQKCMKRIQEFKAAGGAIVFVSHDMNAVKVVCDKALLLEQGRVVESGTPDDVINAYNYLVANRSCDTDLYAKNADPANGYGNHKAVIKRICLLDPAGREAQILTCGRKASVRISISSHTDIENLTVGIGIRDRFGQDMYGTNSCYMEKKVGVSAGEEIRVEYVFEVFNIGTGKYTVNAALHTGVSHVDDCIHWMDMGASFEMVLGNDPLFIGMVQLKPELKVIRKEPT